MKFRVLAVELFRTELRLRLPFRFGAVTLREATLLTARASITSDGARASVFGHAAELCVPKWFDKNPQTTVAEDIAALCDAARMAARTFVDGAREATAFAHWRRAYTQLIAPPSLTDARRMVLGFGLGLCERAIIDAACRAADVSFFTALREDRLGFRPGDVYPELGGFDLAHELGPTPADRVEVRHTVGLLDALTAEELAARGADAAVDDGLPRSLDADIRRYGLRNFKLKIGAGPVPDRARLLAIADVLQRELGDALLRITLDGNEQYADLDALATLLDSLRAETRGRHLLDALAYIEQPLPRALSFDARALGALPRISAIAPVIIDEADSSVDCLPTAHALGYRGVSVKNCKGVFRTLAHRGLCAAWNDGSFQAAEDLTNLGVLALQQDLCTVAALGLPHVERNGHHYVRGLAHLPPSEVRAALHNHATLYDRLDAGDATLGIHAGALDLSSLQCRGYGYDVPIDVTARTPL